MYVCTPQRLLGFKPTLQSLIATNQIRAPSENDGISRPGARFRYLLLQNTCDVFEWYTNLSSCRLTSYRLLGNVVPSQTQKQTSSVTCEFQNIDLNLSGLLLMQIRLSVAGQQLPLQILLFCVYDW